MQGLEEIYKIHGQTTSGYRPQTNGALERTHLGLIEYVRQFIEKFDDWDLKIPFAMFSYNTSIHESTGFTPYELVFGRKARTPTTLPTEDVDTYPTYLMELVQRLHDTRSIATQKLLKANTGPNFITTEARDLSVTTKATSYMS